MTSINDRDAGRDAEDYDNDRKEGRYSASGDRAAYYPVVSDWGMRPGDAEKQIAVDAAIAQIEAAFGKWDRTEGRYIPHPAKPQSTDWLSVAGEITGGGGNERRLHRRA